MTALSGPRQMALGLVAGLALTAAPAAAQRLTVELKVGTAVGTYTATGAGLELQPRLALGAVVEKPMTTSFAGYAGFTRSSFGCEEGFCANRDVTLTSQGLVAGVRWTPGLFWGRAGVAFQALTVASTAPNETSNWGIGWDLGAGVELPVGRGVRLRPGLTYLRHGAVMDGDKGHAAVFAFDVGVAIGL